MSRISLVILSVVFLFSCGTEGEAPSAVGPQNAVSRGQGPAEAQPASEDFFRERVEAVGQLLLKHQPEKAFELLEATWPLSPPEPFLTRLRALDLRCRRALRDGVWMSARVEFSQKNFEMGAVVVGEVIVENRSSEILSIPATRAVSSELEGKTEETSASILRTTVTYREYVPDGTLVTESDVGNFFLDRDIRLDPGETRRFPVDIDTLAHNPSGLMLRTYTVSGRIYAPYVLVGDVELPGPVDVQGATIRVYPRGAKHLAKRPLERVREAFRKSSPIHLTLAASYVQPDELRELLEFLVTRMEAPETSEAMRNALVACFQILAGDGLNRDRAQWSAWAKKRIGEVR